MKPKAWPLLVRCVEEGISRGWMLAHKHTKKPSAEEIKGNIEAEIMGEVCDWFELDGEIE